jgi:hypothetical protein
MPGSQLIEAEHKIILRNADLVDIAEIRSFTQWQHTLKLNEVSSWQLDMHTSDFEGYGIDPSMGIKLYRDDVLIFDGPIMPKGINQILTTGVETTRIMGGCDNMYMMGRICYPVVTGGIFDATVGTWKFGVLRSPIGISSTITKGCDSGMEFDIPLVVENAESFLGASTVAWIQSNGTKISNWNQLIGTTPDEPDRAYNSAPLVLAGVDLSTNTLTIAVPQQYPALLAPAFPSGMIYQTSGDILVDDPTYVGFDTRSGVADDVAKQLVYFNAGQGACSDDFSPRAWKHLYVAAPNAQGSIVTSNARGESLLTQVQNVCLSGGINFHITQVGDELVFDTFRGNDLTQNKNLVLSQKRGNLTDYSYSYGAPTANMIWGCGPETGVDKLMLPSGDVQSIKDYGRWESWISSASAKAGTSTAEVAANMVQTNNATLAASLVNCQLTLTIQETDQVRYIQDFNLGDKIRVMIGSKPVDEVITNITYTIPTSARGGSGSTLTAALSKQETLQMKQAKATQKLLRTLVMT